MAAIIGWGYPASDVERKVIDPETEQEVIAAQLGDLAPDATSDCGTTAENGESGEADGAEAPNDADHADVEDPADAATAGIDDIDDAGTDDQSDTATDYADGGTGSEPFEQETEAGAELIGVAI